MRIMEYQLHLVEPYRMTNNLDCEDGDPLAPGIELVLDDCASLGPFVGGFKFVYCREGSRGAPKPIKWELLQGKLPGWKLVCVTICRKTLYLSYVNTELYREYLRKLKLREQGETVDLHEQGYTLELASDFANHGKAKLRFMVPGKDGSTDTILVETPIAEGDGISVTEFDGEKKRRLRFLGSSTLGYGEIVWVREFR